MAFAFIICCSLSINAKNTANCIIDNRFGAKERSIIAKACEMAVERMQLKETRDRLAKQSGYAWLTRSTVDDSNITDNQNSHRNLLSRQLYTLSLPNGPNDVELPFPDIYIQYKYERANWLGRAKYDLVTIYWDSKHKEWKQKGKFLLTLNDYYVGSRRYSSANDWSGTIAHEMAHNLGHRHPDASDSDYRRYQINILDEIVESYGIGSKGSMESFRSEITHDNDAEESSGPVTITINGRTVTIKE